MSENVCVYVGGGVVCIERQTQKDKVNVFKCLSFLGKGFTEILCIILATCVLV